MGSVLMRMMAVHPNEIPGADSVSTAGDLHIAFTGEAINQLMTGKVFPANEMSVAADHVAGARNGIEDVLMDRVGRRVERDGKSRQWQRTSHD